MKISTEQYGRSHYKNGPANAFRHALWNFLIAQCCYNWRKKEKASLNWAEKITDWHEHAFPNRELAKQMDLHNNKVGRFIFQKMKGQTTSQVVEVLKQMTSVSIKVESNSNLNNHKNKLIHITDES